MLITIAYQCRQCSCQIIHPGEQDHVIVICVLVIYIVAFEYQFLIFRFFLMSSA